jgi:PIN domain nuclease of toxin-antitoxin system
MLSHGGRLKLNIELSTWVGRALKRPKIELLPFTPDAAIRAPGLGGSFPGDPADRFIVAAALQMKAPVITRDQRISDWGQVETIW